MRSWSLVHDDGVAVVSYVGDERSLSLAAVTELADLVESFPSAPYVTGVLLNGPAKRFIPDADREELTGWGPETDGDPTAWHRVTAGLGSLWCPAVAAIDGPARGGAAVLALACTFRLASDRSSFGPVEHNMGIVGTSCGFRLVPLVGPAVATELMVTGREVVAEDLAVLGLVNAVLPADGFSEQVTAWCRGVAGAPREQFIAVKQMVDVASRSRCGAASFLGGDVAGGAAGCDCLS